MTIQKTQRELIEQLKREGLEFTTFTFSTEGNYAISDADWNYKDVPHLNIIHPLVNAYLGYVGDDVITTINSQKIMGVKMPLCVANYQSAKNRQTYFTTLLMYVLIVETSYEAMSETQTRVSTTYAVGSSPFFQLFVPMIKYVLHKNFVSLMGDDIPMRDRRGELRQWGFSFKGDNRSYGFLETMAIQDTNIIPPANAPIPAPEVLSVQELLQGEHFIGRSDHYGLRLRKLTDRLEVYPRICPHEGARLDDQAQIGEKLQCPWHGRVFKPLAVINLQDAEHQTFQTKFHQIRYDGIQLEVRFEAIPDEMRIQPCEAADICTSPSEALHMTTGTKTETVSPSPGGELLKTKRLSGNYP